MASGSVYEWLRGRGCWLTRGTVDRPATHLMLDGGRAAVPDDMQNTFLNAYASSVVRNGPASACIVELRTPVFRLFLDVDARWAEEPPPDVLQAPGVCGVLTAALAAAREAFPDADTDAVVCGGWKHGLHVTWPEVFVTAATALEFRKLLLDKLVPVFGDDVPFASPLDAVIDACVFRANGLRMVWAGKGRGAKQHYAPIAELRGAGVFPVQQVVGVSGVREYVRRLSVRSPGQDATFSTLNTDASGPDASAAASSTVVGGNLTGYADVLPALDAALPLQFVGQKFVGLVRGEACFMLRSTSRWCGNLGRTHRTNNVYFVLTRKGIHQRCYCRCDTLDGRKYGLCKDYSSETWPVTPEVLAVFFDAADPPPVHAQDAPLLPSQVAKSALDMGSLLARRVEAPTGRKRARRK